MSDDMEPLAIPPSSIGQRGAALVVSMMMLVAITLVGVAVMGNSRLEWLMASNSNLQTTVLPQAQRTLADAENWLTAPSVVVCYPPPKNCNSNNFPNWPLADALFTYDGGSNPLPVDPRVVANWNGLTSNNDIDSTGNLIGRYIVVYQGCAFPLGVTGNAANCGTDGTTPFVDTYEIWALSTDARGTARIARSTFVTSTIPTGASTWRRVGYSEISG